MHAHRDALSWAMTMGCISEDAINMRRNQSGRNDNLFNDSGSIRTLSVSFQSN